jgi:hypothetical protein
MKLSACDKKSFKNLLFLLKVKVLKNFTGVIKFCGVSPRFKGRKTKDFCLLRIQLKKRLYNRQA